MEQGWPGFPDWFDPETGGGSSQSYQHPQPVLHDGHGRRSDAAPALDQAVFADGADGFAEEGGGVGQAAFGRLDGDVKRDGPERGSDGNDDNEIGAALIERIDGNDEDWTAAGLFVPQDGIQVCQPNLAPARTRVGRRHRSDFEFFQSVGSRGIQGLDFLAVGIPSRGIRGENFVGGICLVQEALPAVVFQGCIQNFRHGGTGYPGQFTEKIVAVGGYSYGRRHTTV